ncbi:MAG: hypothetical protein IJD79_03480 [Clostridia bacterium]|nr:hypothetical protein [Clostridia bacterium]
MGKVIALLLVIILPIALLFGYVFSIPPQYTNTFVGELDDKFERLTSIDEPKIVVVGGSSVAFGLESELLEKYTDMPVVNFGLYAALGTKVMLDLSKAGIGEGDIVILSPELDAQTMSMYFNSETTLQATDDNPAMLRYVAPEHYFSLLGSLWDHVGQKLEYQKDGAPNPSGVYNGNNFNEYGDLEYERPGNVMALYYDPNTVITLDESILDEEFIDYMNDYIKYCEKKGATVYFSYCPMNHMALADGTTDESIAAFDALMKEKINCKFISYIEDYILAPGYFYDTNFHLNDAGSVYRTLQLATDLMLEMNITTLIEEKLPEVPALKDGMIEVTEKIEGGEFFTYEALANGNYKITGLTEAGKAEKTLTIPLGVEIGGSSLAAAITIIDEGAFAGGVVETVIIPENTYVTQLNNGVFRGSGTVKRLLIYKAEAETINPPFDFSGIAEGFEVHAPEGSDYTTSYYWSQLKGITVKLVLD